MIRASLRWFVGLCAIVFFDTGVQAQDAATIYSAQGKVEYRSGGGDWAVAAIGQKIQNQDTIRTGAASRAALVLTDGLMVRLNQNSLFQVTLDGSKVPSELTLSKGDAHFFSRKEKEFPTIKTDLVSASIRGTELTVSAASDSSEVVVLSGLVRAENTFGGVDLSGGMTATVKPGRAPQKAILVNPVAAVQWALHYPVSIDLDELPEFSAGLSEEEERGAACLRVGDGGCAQRIFTGNIALHRLGRAVALHQLGDDDGALGVLGEDSPSPSFDTIRSALFLARGQVSAAEAALARAEHGAASLPPASAGRVRGALAAQHAIIAVTRNDIGKGRELADQATRLLAGSTTAALAASYVAQSGGSIETAYREIADAVERHPGNPTLLLRRSELQLSRGESADALADAERVTTAMPGNSYGLTVRGFAQLARLDVEGARSSFEQAIKLGSGDGLPFLGLGLTMIRRGDLEGGRTAIQQAAHLEPARALYRSYLGKALFEQENEALAAEEYDRAIALDPKDPTPYLYRTFLHLSRNEPVKALDDIQSSIELNDNRKVYRSRLLLDQDESVRTSSLAEVYTTLGFTDLARVEALRAISQDYANYSAHLDLSQSYESVSETLQASISEFFIARLLSPVNFNLVRPSQSGSLSGNDYSAVFDRDQSRTSVDVSGRTKDSLVQGGLLFSGTKDRWGWALSHAPTYADGYRDNDRTSDFATYGSLQYQLAPDTSILLDANAETFDNGDTEVGYDPYANDPDETSGFDDYIVRLGMNHRMAPGSQVIGQVVASHSNLRGDDPTFDRIVYAYLTAGEDILDASTSRQEVDQRFRFKSNNLRGDLQHIYSSAAFSNVFGGGIFHGSQDQDETATVPVSPEISVPLESSAENTEMSRRAYDYLTFHVTPWFDLQGGLSYTYLHLGGAPLSVPFVENIGEREFWSPKVGAILTPTDSTTIRAAFFETSSSAGVRELELIEPTVVSGFNQTFFELFPGTTARAFAFGIDQKLPTKTYVGAQLIKRAVTRNFPLSVSQIFFDIFGDGAPTTDIFVQENEAHLDSNQGRLYLYQVLGSRVSLTSDYLRDLLEDNLLNNEVDTDRLRFGLNYFFPTGWFAFSRATWRNQSITANVDAEEGTSSEVEGDAFWLIDVGVGYRIPKRHGRIALSLNNVFDTDFDYLATGFEPGLVPGINAFLNFSYNF